MPSLLCRQPQKHSRGSASTTRYSRNRAPTSIARRRAQKCRMPLYKSAIESQLDIQICSTTPSHAQPLRPRATPKTWEFPFERKLYNFRNSRNGPPSQARGPPYPDLCIADICVPCVLARPSAMQPLTHGAANENCPGPTSSLCRAGAYTAGLASNNFTYTGSQAPTSSLDGTDAAILNLPSNPKRRTLVRRPSGRRAPRRPPPEEAEAATTPRSPWRRWHRERGRHRDRPLACKSYHRRRCHSPHLRLRRQQAS